MKATVTRKELYEGLQVVARIAATQTSLPIIRSVLVEAGVDALKLSATDLEMSAEVFVPAVVIEGGTFAVPAKAFLDRIAPLPEADVTLTVGEGLDLGIACRRANSHLRGVNPEEFPALPEVTGDAFSLGQSLLKEMIAQTIFAASEDATRTILMSVCFVAADGLLTMQATDTHQLARRKTNGLAPLLALSALVPPRVLAEVSRTLTDGAEAQVEVRFDRNQVRFNTGRSAITSRLIDGEFPRVERVIPSSFLHRLTINRADLQAAVKRVRVESRDDQHLTNRVVFAAEGEALILSAYGENGNSTDELEIEREGDEISLAMNADYVLSVLDAMKSESIYMELTQPLSPVVFRPVSGDDYLALVMPMQVQ